MRKQRTYKLKHYGNEGVSEMFRKKSNDVKAWLVQTQKEVEAERERLADVVSDLMKQRKQIEIKLSETDAQASQLLNKQKEMLQVAERYLTDADEKTRWLSVISQLIIAKDYIKKSE